MLESFYVLYVLKECAKVPLGGLMSKKRLNQMKRLWHILDCEKVWSAFGDIGVSKEVLSIRMLSLSDTKVQETTEAEYIHCTSLTTFLELLWSLPTSATRSTFTCTKKIMYSEAAYKIPSR